MCMLSYFPPGIMPKEERISNGADANPDGHGFAIVTGRAGSQQLTIFKSMDRDETLTRFLDARRKNLNGPALFHSRIATSGLVDVTGCHPFKVGSDNRTVVAHNGILFRPDASSMKSDTRIFAETMLPRFGSLDRQKKLRKVEEFAGPNNKLLVLTVNPKYRRNAYLINGRMGNWIDGEWHSNYDYEDWSKWTKKNNYGASYGPYAKAYAKDAAGKSAVAGTGTEPWPCVLCGARDSVSTYTLICDMCLSCNDCEMHRDACECYYSRHSHRFDWDAREGTNADYWESAKPVAAQTKRTSDWDAVRESWTDYLSRIDRGEPGILNGSVVQRKERLAITSGGGWQENS